ncbi:MAG: enhanced serine sensitivity protein SseB [Clostridiales Family XIII bacterium]|nr:enhanced serine sensitivity protein SseB [Clostridiales Family XIII bacterium]
MSENAFRPNPFDDWDAQLRNMRAGGSDVRAFFRRRLRASTYLVPCRPDGKGLSLLATQNNELFLPVFTSKTELDKWVQPHGGSATLPFEMLHHIIVDDLNLSGVVINPFGASLILRRSKLATIENAATGMMHERVTHTGKLIFETGRCTAALVRDFTAALKNSGMEVFEAYILMARQENEAKSHLLFLIDFKGDRKSLFPAVAQAVQPHIKTGLNFELLKADSATLAAARKKSAPVYRKQS